MDSLSILGIHIYVLNLQIVLFRPLRTHQCSSEETFKTMMCVCAFVYIYIYSSPVSTFEVSSVLLRVV